MKLQPCTTELKIHIIAEKQKTFIIWKEKDMLFFVVTEQMLGKWC